MVTMRDVAKAANVAKSTVSAVLNNTAPVSEKTRRRVYRAMKELDYRPNLIAKSLVTCRTGIIGVKCGFLYKRVSGDAVAPFTQMLVPVLNGISDVVFDKGYSILLCADVTRDEFIGRCRSGILEGAVLTTPSTGDLELLRELSKIRFPIVVMGQIGEAVQLDTVDIDNYKSAFVATDYLVKLGHEKIGFITPNLPELFLTQDRLRGFRDAMKQYGLQSNMVEVSDGNVESGKDAMRRLLQSESRPTAVFAASAVVANGALKLLLEQGVKVPDDMSIMSFDDEPVMQGAVSKPTGMSWDLEEMGREVGQLLTRRIEDRNSEYKHVCVPSQIAVRKSCRRLTSF